MFTYLIVVAIGIAVRQVDRWWFSPARGGRTVGTRRDLVALQRERANDVTPVLLMAGHWAEIIGWWGVAGRGGVAGWAVAALAVAVKFRHLQEVSHFAVHGVLTRSPALGVGVTEALAHVPMGLVPVPVRREKHVRRHHPNATVAGVDPNLAELDQAGLAPGVGVVRFALAVVFPLTWAGFADTGRAVAANLSPRACWWRPLAFALVLAVAFIVGGWAAVVFGFAVPRLLLYPQLAWLSLLGEHRWFDAEPDPAGVGLAAVEAARCLRLYPRNPLLALFARGTWLPYGDLFHYAHSVHPAVRWNYLPALERVIGTPHYTPDALLLGAEAVVGRHRRALADQDSTAVPVPTAG